MINMKKIIKIKDWFLSMYEGKLDRLGYLGHLIIVLIISSILSALPYIALTISINGYIFIVVYLVVIVVMLLYVISFIVRRLHDLGKSGFWAVLLFIPLINFGFYFGYLLFAKGQNGKAIDKRLLFWILIPIGISIAALIAFYG